MKQIEIYQKPHSGHSVQFKPRVIKWNKTEMLRAHSFLSSVNRICSAAKKKDVIKIGIIGEEDTGKSTLAEALGHAIHIKMEKLYNIPFAVRIFFEEDLLDFKNTLKSLTPANYVLVFDDVTFMEGSANKLQINAVKQAVTKIRHLEGGQDVKIILINNYHYSKGLDKYLRQAHFKYFTSVGSEESENLIHVVGKKYSNLIENFIRHQDQILKTDPAYWTVRINAKDHFRYWWRDSFIPVLFFDSLTPRLIVTPTREFMSRACSTCALGIGERYSEVPVGALCDEGEKAHGQRVYQSACRLKLFENGLAVHAKSVINAKRWLDIQLTKKKVTLEQIMLHYGWQVTKTKLYSQLSKVIDDSAQLKKFDDKMPRQQK